MYITALDVICDVDSPGQRWVQGPGGWPSSNHWRSVHHYPAERRASVPPSSRLLPPQTHPDSALLQTGLTLEGTGEAPYRGCEKQIMQTCFGLLVSETVKQDEQ